MRPFWGVLPPLLVTDVYGSHGQNYQLLEANKQCYRPKDRIDLVPALPGVDYITLEACLTFAAGETDCAENIVEWGNSNAFEPTKTGFCFCYEKKCDSNPGNWEVEDGEHVLQYFDVSVQECSNFGACSVSCGGGVQSCLRSCQRTGHAFGGNVWHFGDDGCHGEQLNERECAMQACPFAEDCFDMSACTATCGGGQRQCTRKCINGNFGDIGCLVDEIKIEPCNAQNCPSLVSCNDFGDCSATCGNGTKSCQNECENGYFGDDGCPEEERTNTQFCNEQECPSDIVNVKRHRYDESTGYSKSYNLAEANSFCQAKRQRLCTQQELCNSPIQLENADLWVYINNGDAVQVGNRDDENNFCQTHSEALGSAYPYNYDTTSYEHRALMYCCEDVVGGQIMMASEIELTANTQLESMKIFPQFELNFDVYPTAAVNEFSSIFRVGLGGHNEIYGDQNPAIGFRSGTTELVIAHDLNGELNQEFYTEALPLDTWSRVTVSQLLASDSRRRRDEGETFIFKVLVDGIQVLEMENTQPTEIETAEVWLGDSFSPAAAAMIRNLRFVSHDCPVNTFFDGTECNAFPCPSNECWTYDAFKSTCSVIMGSNTSCPVELKCLSNSIEFSFSSNVFKTTDPADFGEQEGCEPIYNEESDMFVWSADLGQCSQTIRLENDKIVSQKMLSRNMTIADGDSFDIFFGSSSGGATVSLSCNYDPLATVTSRNATVTADFESVYGDLEGYGDFSNALEINYYNADFTEISEAESHSAGELVYIGVQWKVVTPVDTVGYFLKNCTLIAQDVNDQTELKSVSIVQDTCFASRLSAAPVGPTVAEDLLKFQYRVFLYGSQTDQIQHIECVVNFCMLDQCDNQIPVEDADCPDSLLKYTITGY